MTKGQVWPSLFQQKASFSWGQGLLWCWWLYLLFLGNSDRNKAVTMQCIVWCALNLRGSARFHFRVHVWILFKCFDFFAENNIHGVIKSKRKGVWMYIVLITTKKTEGLRSLVLVAYMVWAINFIIDDWYLMVRWFAHRQTLQAAMAMLCSGAGRDVFCRFSFMASL